MTKSKQIQTLKKAIAGVVKRVYSAESSVKKSSRRLDAARLAFPEAKSELEYAENERMYLSVQYDEIMDTSSKKDDLQSAKLELSRARQCLTRAKTRLREAKSELSGLLK